MERCTVFLDWKNQYCQNDYATQSNLQIQCNPYKITNSIFLKTRLKKNLKIFGDTKEPIAKASSERKTELKVSFSQASDYTTKILSLKQYGHGKKKKKKERKKNKQKYRSVEQNRKPRKKIHRPVVN